MGCMGSKGPERVGRAGHSVTVGEREKVDLSKFAKSVAKRTTVKARPRDYQSSQAPVRPPLYKEGEKVTEISLEEWQIPLRSEERIYRVPRVSYPRL